MAVNHVDGQHFTGGRATCERVRLWGCYEPACAHVSGRSAATCRNHDMVVVLGGAHSRRRNLWRWSTKVIDKNGGP